MERIYSCNTIHWVAWVLYGLCWRRPWRIKRLLLAKYAFEMADTFIFIDLHSRTSSLFNAFLNLSGMWRKWKHFWKIRSLFHCIGGMPDTEQLKSLVEELRSGPTSLTDTSAHQGSKWLSTMHTAFCIAFSVVDLQPTQELPNPDTASANSVAIFQEYSPKHRLVMNSMVMRKSLWVILPTIVPIDTSHFGWFNPTCLHWLHRFASDVLQAKSLFLREIEAKPEDHWSPQGTKNGVTTFIKRVCFHGFMVCMEWWAYHLSDLSDSWDTLRRGYWTMPSQCKPASCALRHICMTWLFWSHFHLIDRGCRAMGWLKSGINYSNSARTSSDLTIIQVSKSGEQMKYFVNIVIRYL